jgi:hypothetical protein
MFRGASGQQQNSLYELGKQKNLFQTTDLPTFQSAWSGAAPMAAPVQPQEEVKKKVESVTTELPVAGSLSGSQLPQEPVKPQPIQEQAAQPQAAPQFFQSSLDIITPELINDVEEVVVPKMNYQFGPMGFKFEESGVTGDWMVATAPNGAQAEFSLDPFLSESAEDEAQKLKQWISANTNTAGLATIEDQYKGANRKFQSQEEIDKELKKTNQNAESFNYEVRNYLIDKSALEKEKEFLDNNASDKSSTDYLVRQSSYNANLEQLKKREQELTQKQNLLQQDSQSLSSAVGKYAMMSEQQGTFGGFLWNKLTEGLSMLAPSVVNVITDIGAQFQDVTPTAWNGPKAEAILVSEKLGYNPPSIKIETDVNGNPILADEQDKAKFNDWYNSLTKEEKDSIESKIRDDISKEVKYGKPGETGAFKAAQVGYKSTIGDSTTDEYSRKLEDDSFLAGALGGVTKSLPAMIGGGGTVGWVQRGIQMYGQATDAIYNEMADNPEFKDVSESEKRAIAMPIGIAEASLEAIGLRNVIANKGLLNRAILSAIGKSGATTTAKTFGELVRNEITSKGLKAGLTLTGAALAEAETGALQQVSEYAFKDIYNAVKEKDMFQTPEFLSKEYFADIGKAAAAEAIGGLILGMPSAVSTAYSKKGYRDMNNQLFNVFEASAKDPEIQRAFVVDLKTRVARGEISLEQAKKTLNDYRNSVGLFNSVPENLNTNEKKDAMNLLKEKRDLEQQIEGKDESLTRRQRNRISEINTELETLSETADTRPISITLPTGNEVQIEREKEGELNALMSEYDELNEEKEKLKQNYSPFGVNRATTQEEIDNEVEQNWKTTDQGKRQAEILNEITALATPAPAAPAAQQQGILSTPEATTAALEQLPSEERANIVFMREDLTQAFVMGNERMLSELYHQAMATPEAERTPSQLDAIDAVQVSLKTQLEQEAEQMQQQPRAERGKTKEAIFSNVMKSLASIMPGLKVTRHADFEEMKAYAEQMHGRAVSQRIVGTDGGMIIYDSSNKPVAILINDEVSDPTTFPHEVWHAIFFKAFGNNPALFKEFQDRTRQILLDNGYDEIVTQLDAFVETDEYQESDTQAEEWMVQLGGALTASGIDAKNLNQRSKTLLEQIKNLFNQFAMRIAGQPIFLEDATPEDILDFMASISDRMARGESIAEFFKDQEQKQTQGAGPRVSKQVTGETGFESNWNYEGEGDAFTDTKELREGKSSYVIRVLDTMGRGRQYYRAKQRGELDTESPLTYKGTQEDFSAIDGNGNTVGVIKLQTDGGVMHLAVAAEFSRKGVATELIKRIEQEGAKVRPEKSKQISPDAAKLFNQLQSVKKQTGKTGFEEAAPKTESLKNIDVKLIRTLSRAGKRVSKGLAVYTKDKKKVVEEAPELSLQYVKENAPKLFISNANLIKNYPIIKGVKEFGNITTAEQAQEVYDIFTRQIADNLKYLMDNFREDLRDIATLWYDGANILAQNLGKQYGITTEQAAGMIASLSPQKDWYQNVRLAELVMMAFKDNPVMSDEMIAKQKEISAKGLEKYEKAAAKAEASYKKSRSNKRAEKLREEKKKLEEVKTKNDKVIADLAKYVGTDMNTAPDYLKPYYARLYHEINTTKDYNILSPDGNVLGIAKKKGGENAKVAWGSYTEIGKAVDIYLDGSQENITRTLGEMHKIRNFYNNIIDPMSPDKDVTMDTHAVAAALLLPLSGEAKQVKANFGTGTANSAPLGIKGLYYAFAEGYNLAAEESGLLPRQVQSITWEAVRGLFTDDFKRNAKKVAEINGIVNDYANKKITLDESRKKIFESAGGINTPSWAGGPLQEGLRENVEQESVGGGSKRVGLGAVGTERGKPRVKKSKASPEGAFLFRTEENANIGFQYDTDKVARERFNIYRLEKIGAGSDRVVFDLGDGKVLKVAKTARGLEQNIYEGDAYNSVIPNVFERGLNYVVTEKADPLRANNMVPVYNEDGDQIGEARAAEMIDDLERFIQRDFDNHTEEMQTVLMKYGLQDIINYNVLWPDFAAIRNWGYKDGMPLHVDGGTFGGVEMLKSRSSKNLTDPEFKEIYDKSKKAKKEFGDNDVYVMFQKTGNTGFEEVRKVAQRYNVNTQGFAPKQVNDAAMKKELAPLGFSVKRARVDEQGRGGGVFIIDGNGRFYNPFSPKVKKMDISRGRFFEEEDNIANIPGYDRLITEIEGIIQRGKRRGAAPDRIMQGVMNYVMTSAVYERANDVQREQMVRNIQTEFGKRLKSAPSVGRLLGTIKDVKNITLSEKELLKQQIKSLARGARTAVAAYRAASRELVKEIDELRLSGKVTTKQVSSVLKRFANVNMFNEDSVDKFVEYMAKVFNDANYAEKIDRARRLLPTAKRNIRTKIGIAEAAGPLLQQMFAINPSLIPDAVLDKYLSLVEMFGEKATVLKLGEVTNVIATANEILDAVDEEVSLAEELAIRFENYPDKVFDDNGKLDYAATLAQMQEQNVITEEDAKLMQKYKNLILPKVQKPEMTEAEIEQEKNVLISVINSLDVDDGRLPTRDERGLAQQLKSLLKPEILKQLTIPQLKNVIKLIDNINNGYLPHYAELTVERLDSFKNSGELVEAVEAAKPLSFSKIYSRFKSIFTRKNATLEMVRRSPLYYIDQVFGDFKTKKIFDSVFKGVAEAQALFDSEMNKINKKLDDAHEAVNKSFKYDSNKSLMSSFKMMTYMLQLEYESNPNNKEVHPVSKVLKATIKHIDNGKSKYGDREANMLQEILDNYTTDGEIDINRLYDSFNPAEKKAIKTIQEINESLRDKAVYTAAVIRGDRINPLNNYVHHYVMHEYSPDNNATGTQTADEYNNSMRPSTRAQSLIERTRVVSPMNFDVFASAQRGAKFVLLDYTMTKPIRTARKTLSQTQIKLEEQGRVPKEQREVFNAIDGAFDEVVRNVLTNNFVTDSIVEEAVNFISKTGYRAILASVPRFIAELSSNIGFVMISDPKGFANGMKYKSIVMSPSAVSVLDNVGSKQTTRLFHGDTLSGRLIDRSIISQSSGVKGAVAKNDVANVANAIYNMSLKKYKNVVELLADGLISTPDKIVMRPLWFGTFATEFKSQTGQEVDFDKIASNDEAYMNEYKEAIKNAKDKADERTTLAGATDNAFMGMLKGTSKPNQSAFIKAFNNFNNFMTRFAIYEYTTARQGIYAAMGNGTLSRKEGIALLAAVTTRMTTYTLLSSMLGNGMLSLFADDDEDDEKSFMQKFSQSLASTATGLIVGRDFGNATKSLLNYGVEEMNEKFLTGLREGDYDPYKDAISYSIVPKERKGQKTNLTDFITQMGGSFGPALKTADLITRKAFEAPKKEEAAIERGKQETQVRIPLEVLGHLGYVPLYKDIRKIVMDQMYKDLENADKKVKDKKQAEKEMLHGYENKTDMKRYNPELYEQVFGEKSPGYDAEQAKRKIEKEKEDLERRRKDELYDYTPKKTQEKSGGFGSKKFGGGTKKQSGGFGSKKFGE